MTQKKPSNYIQYLPNLVATWSRASVYERSLAGIAGSKRAGRHRCQSLVSCVLSGKEVSVSGRSLIQRSPTEGGVHECDRGTPSIRNPWPIRAVQQWKKK